MNDIRQKAFNILKKIQINSAYSNLSLNYVIENDKLEERDSALLTALVYGTLERLITIDYNLRLYLKEPIVRLRPEVLASLRLGAYQILYMDKIPASAAVDESVKIIKKTKCAFAAGLTNAVLRKIAGNGLVLPKQGTENLEFLSVKYSFPEWVISLWIKSYGTTNTIALLDCSLTKPPAYIRVNSLRTSEEDLIKLLKEERVESKSHGALKNTLILEGKGSVENLLSFKNGLFHFQDLSSQILCQALDVKPGDIVFDICSAPGGKAFTLAENVGVMGKVFAFDIKINRLDLIRKGAERLKISNLSVAKADACQFTAAIGQADVVLCDVPCSGLGVFRRKPEIRYKIAADIDKLPELQYFILCNASRYVRHGGILAYSTCTLNLGENDAVCDKFLEEHSEYEVFNNTPNQIKTLQGIKYTTLLPHMNNSDGFFFALFRRMV
jgi:16S rRNA (cytosine967-C5)-methyltransferase